MKAFLLVFMAFIGGAAAWPHLQKLAVLQTGLTFPSLAPSQDATGTPIPAAEDAPVVATDTPSDDVLRKYGEPMRKERAMDGTVSWFYPVYVIYIRNGHVIDSNRVATAAAPIRNPANGSQLWHNNGAAANGTAAGSSTWQPHTTSLGSSTLKGTTGQNQGAVNNWQNHTSTTTTSAPRTTTTWSRPANSQGQTGGSNLWH